MFNIVIPAYIIDQACEDMTQACIDSVVENTTVPFSFNVIRSYPSSRMTYAQAVNEGLKTSKGRYIVILNNDVEVSAGWIEAMIECFALPNCGIGTLLGKEHSSLHRDAIVEDFYGPCWMVSRKALDKVGLLDETYVNSFEDSDYWVRMYQAGFKIYRNCNVIVNHKERATCRKIKEDNSDFIRNKEYFNSKYGELDLPIYKRLRG